MRAAFRMLLAALTPALCAQAPPADDQDSPRAKMERLLDVVRANDEARFATLVGGLEGAVPEDPYSGPTLGDYGADPQYYGSLTLASLRRFATACRYDGPDPNIPADPLVFGGRYTCNGEPGHTLNAQFSVDGRRAVWITIMSPADHRALAEQNERMAAQDAVTEAARLAEVNRIAGAVDALFAAAREGDQVRFRALLGRGHRGEGASLSDMRGPAPQVGPLTLEALRPIATACRRATEEEPYQYHDMMEQLEQQAPYVCDGEAGYILFTGFEQNGAKISWLRLEGRVRRPLP